MMEAENHKSVPVEFVFGPVPSRRLGRSLGVDLIPFKTCTFDCIYCQLGRTTVNTLERFRFEHVEELLKQLQRKIERGPRPDYVTISGSGEPTLCSNLTEVMTGIKGVTDVPVAVLTNGSLFHLADVRCACAMADLVLPSLDAGSEEIFQYINRPCKGLTLEMVTAGLKAFRKEFKGEIWLEVFLIGGVNTLTTEVERIVSLVREIQPDRVQLNTAVRPTAETYAYALDADEMKELAERFGPGTEIIADFPHPHDSAGFKAEMDDILNMIKRRPCTLEDITDGLDIHANEAVKYLEELCSKNLADTKRVGGKVYYAAR